MESTRWRRAVALAALAICAPGVVKCTYDFDHFVDSAVGGAATPGTTQPSGRGGSAANLATGGGAAVTGGQGGVAGFGGASGGTTTVTACAGVSYASICWYLGASGSSCLQVCAPHGQVAPNLANFVGSAAQGGSVTQCAAILALLGVSQNPVEGIGVDGFGIGCNVLNGVAWWLSSPAFSTSASYASARIVCGCTQ